MCFVVRARIASSTMMPMPINAPIRIKLQSMSAAMTPCASEEIKPACGAGERIGTQFRARRADESIRLIHQVEHRRNDERASEHTDDQCDLLLPRRRIDQLTGLEVLQIVVRDRGDVENHRGGEKREGHERFARFRPHVRLYAEHKQQRRADHDQNADARERTVR